MTVHYFLAKPRALLKARKFYSVKRVAVTVAPCKKNTRGRNIKYRQKKIVGQLPYPLFVFRAVFGFKTDDEIAVTRNFA